MFRGRHGSKSNLIQSFLFFSSSKHLEVSLPVLFWGCYSSYFSQLLPVVSAAVFAVARTVAEPKTGTTRVSGRHVCG